MVGGLDRRPAQARLLAQSADGRQPSASLQCTGFNELTDVLVQLDIERIVRFLRKPNIEQGGHLIV
ncbi:hypothetical protein D3C84_1040050 [compost metagenome]